VGTRRTQASSEERHTAGGGATLRGARGSVAELRAEGKTTATSREIAESHEAHVSFERRVHDAPSRLPGHR
jgi:hypothetical protein